MVEPAKSPGRSCELQLKWEIGARGAAAISLMLKRFDATIEIQREGVWFDVREVMGFMLATRIEGSPAMAGRTAGPDGEPALAELGRIFNCEARIQCQCGKPRLIGWNRDGGQFVCAKNHSWFAPAKSP